LTLDLSKAFDYVEHNILFDKLWNSGVRGLPHRWLKPYLPGRSQQVKVNRVTSHTTNLRYGAPHRSILNLFLFLVYVNDLIFVIARGQIVRYADHITLCFNSNKIEEIQLFLKKESTLEFNTVEPCLTEVIGPRVPPIQKNSDNTERNLKIVIFEVINSY